MRQAAKAIGGYYPTPDRVANFLASWLVSSTGPGEIRALDPCCGTGRALDLVTQDLSPSLCTVGVELNRERAAEAQRALSRAVHADVFKIRCTHQAFSLLFLNPPYDDDAGGRREEEHFLQHTLAYLAPKGILVYLIPIARLAHPRICTLLTTWCTDLTVLRFPSPEYEAFKQGSVLGMKKARGERAPAAAGALERDVYTAPPLAALAANRRTAAPLQLFILSHSRAKLRYGWEPAVLQRRWKVDGQRVVQLRCPACGHELLDEQGAALAFADLEHAQRQCPHCRGALWQPITTSRRLFPLAVYIRRKYPGVFDLLVADEAHELKAQSSAQALAFHKLMRACPRTLALTGTLSSGKASDFFPLLYRLAPEIRAQYQHNDSLAFVRDYGILEQVTYHDDTTVPQSDSDEDGSGSIRKGERGKVYERPGLSPAIVPVLLNRFVFLRLSDIAHALPPYEEFVHPLALPAHVARAYDGIESDIISWSREHRGATLAQFLQVLLGYPDQPWIDETVTATIRDQTGNRQRAVVTRTTPCDPTARYPKEDALLVLLQRERARGRKVLIFAVHTDQRDILPRLIEQAAQEGIRLAALRAAGEARTRKQQVQRLLARGADGVVCHPRLVQTGLNLTQFPTIVFFQFDYSTFTLRQASRRSYRPSQTQPVEVHFFCYTGTVQEKGLALMARKLRSALMAEGGFVEDGLSAFGDDGDITRELTRSLLHGHAVPGLEETFRALKEVHAAQRGSRAGEAAVAPLPAPEASEAAAVVRATPHPDAGQRLEALRAMKKAEEAKRGKRITLTRTLAGNPGQLSLFS